MRLLRLTVSLITIVAPLLGATGPAHAQEAPAPPPVEKDGGHRRKLATGVNNLALAMDDQSVYWVDSVGGDAGSDANSFGNVTSTPKDGGRSTPVASEQENPGPIAVDSTSLYWAVDLCASDGGACTGRLLKLTPK